MHPPWITEQNGQNWNRPRTGLSKAFLWRMDRRQPDRETPCDGAHESPLANSKSHQPIRRNDSLVSEVECSKSLKWQIQEFESRASISFPSPPLTFPSP